MSRVTMAEVFEEAKHYLASDIGYVDSFFKNNDVGYDVLCMCTCVAIEYAYNKLVGPIQKYHRSDCQRLVNEALNRQTLKVFDEFEHGRERQGARLMWLEQLRLYAEGEGL